MAKKDEDDSAFGSLMKDLKAWDSLSWDERAALGRKHGICSAETGTDLIDYVKKVKSLKPWYYVVHWMNLTMEDDRQKKARRNMFQARILESKLQ